MTVQRPETPGGPPVGSSLATMVVRAVLQSIAEPSWRPWCRWISSAIVGVILVILLRQYGIF